MEIVLVSVFITLAAITVLSILVVTFHEVWDFVKSDDKTQRIKSAGLLMVMMALKIIVVTLVFCGGSWLIYTLGSLIGGKDVGFALLALGMFIFALLPRKTDDSGELIEYD